MAKNRVVGSPIASDGWQALYFDVNDEGLVERDTAEVIRVACWAGTGARIVGLIPTETGLNIAEDFEHFRGYVDAKVEGSLQSALDAWDEAVEEPEDS